MTVIDPTTDLGRLRLRLGDFGDLPLLVDSVYNQTLIDTANADATHNLPKASILLAQYILAILSFRTHKKLVSIESWSGEAFTNYLAFLKETILNPNAIPASAPQIYSKVSPHFDGSIAQFIEDWKHNYYRGTQSRQLHRDALLNPVPEDWDYTLGGPYDDFR